jgi:hypothetical protein
MEEMGKITPASLVEEGMNHHQLNSSLRANSSDFGDIIMQSEENDHHPKTTTAAAATADDDASTDHHHDDELTAEEKKEADFRITSSAAPRSKEVIDSSANYKVANNTLGSSSVVTFKFSYEPRDYEQEYYDKLFYHVAATSNISAAVSTSSAAAENKPEEEELIVSPKEAAKLFYTSGVPPERLRMIWNMATLPSSPLPAGAKPPPSMTYGQFRVAVRLIQLFQNRVAAVDEQLNIAGGEGGGGSKSDNGLAPAFFNGVSGEIIPLPKNNMTDATETTNQVPLSKSNGVTRQVRRRSSRNSFSSLSTNEEKKPSKARMNGNMPAYNETTYSQPMPLAEMESEIRRLSAIVSTLQREVKELKRGKAYYMSPRNNVADEDPSVDVEIYWGARKEKEQTPDKTETTPSSELPLKQRASTSSINSKSSMPTHPPQFAAMNNRRHTRNNRLSQSQNIPTMHPSFSRRARGNLGMSTSGAASGTVHVSQQPLKIPEDGESLTAQMHAVRKEEEFDTLLSHAKDRMEGDGGSNAGSRQSNRSGSFRPVRLNQSMVMQQRNPSGNRPAELAASARHIVRDKEGKVEVYSREKVEPPSTKAIDLAPLNPPPIQYSYEELSSQAATTQNHRKSLTSRRRW